MKNHGYYTQNSARCNRIHHTMMNLYRPRLQERFGEQVWQGLSAQANAGFRLLLEQIPYIGGNANPFTRILVQSASLLALWRQLEPLGITLDEFGRLTDEVLPTYLERYPPFILRSIGRLYLSKLGKRRMERQAKRSEQRVHAGDFVYSVVDRDLAGGFAWGIDYHECGIVKFLQAQGAEKLAPYMCLLDYAAFPALGIELRRSGTIAQGHARCDFRFSVRRS